MKLPFITWAKRAADSAVLARAVSASERNTRRTTRFDSPIASLRPVIAKCTGPDAAVAAAADDDGDGHSDGDGDGEDADDAAHSVGDSVTQKAGQSKGDGVSGTEGVARVVLGNVCISKASHLLPIACRGPSDAFASTAKWAERALKRA